MSCLNDLLRPLTAIARRGQPGRRAARRLAQQTEQPPKRQTQQQQKPPAKPRTTTTPAKPTAPPAAAKTEALPPSQVGIGTLAKQAFMVDPQTSTVLLFKDADKPMHPSSMAKLMTIYIAFEELNAGRLKLDTRFRVSERARNMGGSRMFVELGSEVIGRGPDQGHDRAVGQRRLRGDRRRDVGQRGQLRRAHDRQGARARHDRHGLQECVGLAGRRPVDDGARSRGAVVAHHRGLPQALPLLRGDATGPTTTSSRTTATGCSRPCRAPTA